MSTRRVSAVVIAAAISGGAARTSASTKQSQSPSASAAPRQRHGGLRAHPAGSGPPCTYPDPRISLDPAFCDGLRAVYGIVIDNDNAAPIETRLRRQSSETQIDIVDSLRAGTITETGDETRVPSAAEIVACW